MKSGSGSPDGRILVKRLLMAVLAASVLPLAACGLDCEEYCAKMDDCEDGDCDSGQCVEFCEQALDNDEVGFEESAICALDVSCDDLDDGACFPWGDAGRGWCR